MKKLGYYPALTFLLLVCLLITGAFIYQSAMILGHISKYKSSGEMLRNSQAQLEAEQLKLANNQKSDKAYDDYFTRWIGKECRVDETKLKLKLQKMAEELGINIYEIVPLSTPDTDTIENNGKNMKANPMSSKSMLLKNIGPSPNPAGYGNTVAADMIELKMTLLGPFPQLMIWMEKAENELGSLRFVQVRWIARSPDEVRLTIGLRYKMMGEAK